MPEDMDGLTIIYVDGIGTNTTRTVLKRFRWLVW